MQRTGTINNHAACVNDAGERHVVLIRGSGLLDYTTARLRLTESEEPFTLGHNGPLAFEDMCACVESWPIRDQIMFLQQVQYKMSPQEDDVLVWLKDQILLDELVYQDGTIHWRNY
jgi:hypothetical protein